MEIHVIEKVHRVFQALTQNSLIISDDTLLNKLVDILCSSLNTVEEVEECGIPEFLQACQVSSIPVPSLVFGIKVAGILVTKATMTDRYQKCLTQMLESTLSHDFIEAPSIGEALYTVLKEVPSLVALSLDDLMDKTLETLKQRCSIFLRRAVIQFVISLYSKHTDDSKELHSFVNKICEHILNFVSSKDVSSQKDFIVACFDIVKHLMEINAWRTRIYEQLPDFNDLLLNMIENEDGSLADHCLQCLVVIMEIHRSHTDNSFGIKVIDVIKRLIKKQIMKGQDVCYRLVHSGLIPEHSEWLKHVITLPLQSMVSMETGSELDADLEGHVTSRTESIKLFCFTLEKVDQLRLVDQDIQELVVRTFEVTADEGPSTGVRAYLHDSRKVQQKCLQIINRDTSQWTVFVSRILAVISHICQQSSVDIVTYTKCLDCMAAMLTHTCNSPALDEFVHSLQRHLCDIEWDGREATLSFLKDLFSNYKENTNVLDWVSDHRLDSVVWQSLADSEGYVRSAAVSCLGKVLRCNRLRDHMLTDLSVTMDDVIMKMENLCKSDTEAFVRRAAVDFFTCLWGDNSLLTEHHRLLVLHLMSCDMVKDFDWEVKLKVVHFWRNLIESDNTGNEPVLDNKNVSQISNQEPLLKRLLELVSCGGLEALFILTDDFDNSVVETSLHLIKEIQHLSTKNELYEFVQKMDVHNNAQNDHTEHDLVKKPWRSETFHKDMTNGEKSSLFVSLDKLKSFDVNAKLVYVTSGCDDYKNDPVSLLDDILSYTKSHENVGDDDDAHVIDCY